VFETLLIPYRLMIGFAPPNREVSVGINNMVKEITVFP